jgi:hypothetical protein
LHNFDLAGKGSTDRRLDDREDVLRGGLPFLDINEEMSRDAIAIHGEDPFGLPQSSLESLLRLPTVWPCQHEGDALFWWAGPSRGVEEEGGREEGREKRENGYDLQHDSVLASDRLIALAIE